MCVSTPPPKTELTDLLSKNTDTYHIELTRQYLNPQHLFEHGVLDGFLNFPGLRHAGAHTVSTTTETADNTVTIPTGWVKNPRLTWEKTKPNITETVILTKTVTGQYENVLKWENTPQTDGLWYQIGSILGSRLAAEAENLYHNHPTSGLRTLRNPNTARTVAGSAGTPELLNALQQLTHLPPNPNMVVAPTGHNEPSYLLHPELASRHLTSPPNQLIGNYRWRPNLLLSPYTLKTAYGTINHIAAFGNWSQTFTIADTTPIRVQLVDGTLTAKLTTGGTVTAGHETNYTLLETQPE